MTAPAIVHMMRLINGDSIGTLCRKGGYSAVVTTSKAGVTCLECKNAIDKQDQEEEHAAKD